VQAIVSGEATSSADAARIAGYNAPTAEVAASRGYEVAQRPRVKAALAAIYAAEGGPEAWAHGLLRKYAADDDVRVRAPAVRSIELVMRATGQLANDTTINIDARSILLPGADALSLDALDAELASLAEPEST
jgi:hypothetical protein